MSAFEYVALDSQGNTKKGVLEGDTPRQIRQQLREQGLTPLNLEEVTRPHRKSHSTRISSTELTLFTRQLATLSHSGLTLEEALRAVADQSDKSRLKSMVLAVRSKVSEGHSLAEGLRQFPSVFSELYCATVAAGEQTGHLEVVLERLANYTENRHYLRQKIGLALFYPLLLTLVALLIVIGLLTYVVPQVIEVFVRLHQELPWLTRALIKISDFLQTQGGLLIILIVLSIFTVRHAMKRPPFLLFWHGLLLKLPLIARLEKSSQVAQMTRTLSILVASGVPLLDALHMTSQVISNRVLRRALVTATERVREGSGLKNALSHSGLFPAMTLHLIANGESTGQLEGMLERAAILQERELETLIQLLLSLFEPLLILVMGGVVLLIVLAILLPIFEINQLIR